MEERYLLFLQQYTDKVVSWIRGENYFMRWRYVVPALIIVLLYTFLGQNLKAVFVYGGLAVAGAYSTIYKRVVRIPSAIELVTFGAVITSLAYGPLAGALFGVMVSIATEIISGGIDMFTILYAFARGLIGGIAFLFAGANMVVLGVGMALLFNAICQPFYLLPGDIETKVKAIYFFFINIIFNFVIFLLLGDFLLAVAKV